ncbi:MAG TPA: sigma 54-interacting transcriptional regulator, partial [Candidatus Binatia bacterium]|nr:sigma 54-interacting transcriptional regulator [Candidatus Binatia bacterium]
RVLQEKEIRPVGSTKTHTVSVRMIAATNKNLETVVQNGGFRQDLFYRLNVVRIVVPPLRERKSDIPALLAYFLRRFNERFRRDVKGIAPEAMTALTAYDFPGNVRELENLLERAFALGARDEIERTSLPDLTTKPDAPPAAVVDTLPTLDQAERDLIARALDRFRNDKEQAARALGLTVRTLYRRIKKFGLI